MWIKIKESRVNSDNIISYYPDLSVDWKLIICFNRSESCYTFKKITATDFCNYLDNIFKTGEDKEIRFLELNDELESKILSINVEFKTLEEFKESKS